MAIFSNKILRIIGATAVALFAIFFFSDSRQDLGQALQGPAAVTLLKIAGNSFSVPDDYIVEISLDAPNRNASTETQWALLGLRVDEDGPAPHHSVAATDQFAIWLGSPQPDPVVEDFPRRLQGRIFLDRENQDREVIHPGRAAGLFRGIGSYQPANAWRVVRAHAKNTSLEADEPLAYCWRPKGRSEIEGLKNVNCMTLMEHKNLSVGIWFSGSRLGCISKIVDRARANLNTWDINR